MGNKMKWYARISAIFLTVWAIDSGVGHVRLSMEDLGFMTPRLAITLFLLESMLYFIPSIPLWYYGFKKK